MHKASPYLPRQCRSSKTLNKTKSLCSGYVDGRNHSHERKFTHVPSPITAQIKTLLRNPSRRQRSLVDRAMSQPSQRNQCRRQQTSAHVEISYKSRLFRLEFEYDIETNIGQFVARIKQLLGNTRLLIRTGVLVIDYLLTLPNEKFSLISTQEMSVSAHQLSPPIGQLNSLKNFNILKCVGSGGFSKVYLAETCGLYMALKIMDKQQIIQNNKQSIIINEKSILMKLNHPFITKLYYTIQTESTITFGIEFCVGGELFNILKQNRRMSENQARFYFLEVLSALAELHRNNIIYRDLKPQNIVIDSQGHVKLADYGLSKICDNHNEINESFCGSAEYMAPEMLLRNGHGKQLDLYCLGALLYELVLGIPPFYSKNMDQMFYDIINKQPVFSKQANLSNNLINLLTNLLNKCPDKRMTAQDVLKHPWCNGISFNKINSKQLIPPFKPNLLKYNFDDSEFSNTEMNDMQLISNEKEEGDLILPLFRKFYYESDQIKQLKHRLSEDPHERSISHTTTDTVIRKLSGIRLKTEQVLRQRKSGSKRHSNKPNSILGTNEPVKRQLLSRKLSNCSNKHLKLDKTDSFTKKQSLLNNGTNNLIKIYKNTTMTELKQNRPQKHSIKKAFRGKEYTKKLYDR